MQCAKLIATPTMYKSTIKTGDLHLLVRRLVHPVTTLDPRRSGNGWIAGDDGDWGAR